MRKPLFAALLLIAALAFACAPSSAGFAQYSRLAWNWPGNLAAASILGKGMLPALLFGGSFVGLLLALIAGGCIGIVRNAPPKAPRPKRSRQKRDLSAPDQLMTV